MFPSLTRGACEVIARHAGEELQAVWLRRIVSGDYTGAMALTESAAGTILAYQVARQASTDGGYAVNDAKIFIFSQ